jgi:hypothetical protein
MAGKRVGATDAGGILGGMMKGVAVNIIALDGYPRMDIGALRKVDFVMKDAKV